MPQTTAEWVQWRLDREAEDPTQRPWMTEAVERDGQDNVVAIYEMVHGIGATGGVDLRRRPWAGNPELKALLHTAREANMALSQVLYSRLWGRES